jgi:hypothetical protein
MTASQTVSFSIKLSLIIWEISYIFRLMQSLQRVRERQARASAVPSSRASTRPRVHTPNNTTTIDTITTDPNGVQRTERRFVNNNDEPNPKPIWNSSNVAHPTKTPRSVFLDGRPADNPVPPRQIITATPSNRSIPYSAVTTPVKVVHVSSTTTEEPSSSMPVYIQHPQYTYPTNSKLIRTDPEGKYISSYFYFFI